jgi:hypothetical protein
MSWNIKTPGDYINGPLTVAGSATITGALTVDTNTLVVNAAGYADRVGIGTASPNRNLSIFGASNSLIHFTTTATGPNNTDGFTFGIETDSSVALFNSENTPFVFSVNSTTAMTLNSTGLGVGASPSYSLHVKKDQSSQTQGYIDNQQNNAAASSALTLSAYGGFWNVSVPHSATFVNPLIFKFGSTEVARLTSAGDLVLAGGNTSANGVGVTFPATQVASSDANTLDDYEEGTWVGTLTGGTTTPATPQQATGRYTKIGRQVSVQIAFENVSSIGYLGNISITGLPFANAALRVIGTAGAFNGATFTGTLISQIEISTSAILFYGIVSNAAWASATHNPNATSYLWANLTYTV